MCIFTLIQPCVTSPCSKFTKLPKSMGHACPITLKKCPDSIWQLISHHLYIILMYLTHPLYHKFAIHSLRINFRVFSCKMTFSMTHLDSVSNQRTYSHCWSLVWAYKAKIVSKWQTRVSHEMHENHFEVIITHLPHLSIIHMCSQLFPSSQNTHIRHLEEFRLFSHKIA